jgi:hypothetical protein
MQKRDQAVLAALVIGLLVGVGTTYTLAGASLGRTNTTTTTSPAAASFSTTVTADVPPPIYPPAVVVIETSPTSVLGIPLTTEAASDNGSTTGPQENAEGIAMTTYDTGHLNLTVYRGDYPNGSSVIAVTVSDIGQQGVDVWGLTFGASSPSGVTALESFAIGCTQNSTYTETVSSVNQMVNTTQTTVQTEHFVCSQVASQNSTTLGPGQSLSAYVKVPTSSLDGFSGYGASADYIIVGVAHNYLLSAGYKTPSATF